MAEDIKARIESETEVRSYIDSLRYALNNGAQIDFQIRRMVDKKRNEKYTNLYTVNTLFPNENPTDALRRELLTLSTEEYIRTVRDLHFPKRSELREFVNEQRDLLKDEPERHNDCRKYRRARRNRKTRYRKPRWNNRISYNNLCNVVSLRRKGI